MFTFKSILVATYLVVSLFCMIVGFGAEEKSFNTPTGRTLSYVLLAVWSVLTVLCIALAIDGRNT